MSVGVATALSAGTQPTTFSLGPVKVQLMNYSAASGDTTMTATADTMTTVFYAVLTGGFVETTATTYATNVATFTFTDPAAARHGRVLIFGR